MNVLTMYVLIFLSVLYAYFLYIPITKQDRVKQDHNKTLTFFDIGAKTFLTYNRLNTFNNL